jgi:hypothetical protein
MQGTADFHPDITNALLPQAALTTRQRLTLLLGPVIPEPISSDPWQSMENQPFPTLSVISDRSELSGIGIIHRPCATPSLD